MTAQHQNLANGKWKLLSLCEQMGNIGSEIGRAGKWKQKNFAIYESAVFRAIELIDLTLADERWKNRLKEITRARELVCDAHTGKNEFNSTFESLEKYFNHFAFAARINAGK